MKSGTMPRFLCNGGQGLEETKTIGLTQRGWAP
jgi:hypothetical protein